MLPENDPEQHFEVLAVTDHRGDGDDREYRVKWKHYESDSEDTWEKIDSFDSLTPVKTYLKRRGLLDPSNVRREKNIMQRYANKTDVLDADAEDPSDAIVDNNVKKDKRRRRRSNRRA